MGFLEFAFDLVTAGARIVQTGTELLAKRNADAAELQAALDHAGNELLAALLALRQALPQHDALIDAALARLRAKVESVLPNAPPGG